MRLGFDIDEVVCDLFGALIPAVEKEYGVTIDKEIIRNYNLRNEYTDDKDLNLEIAGYLMYLATDTKFLMSAKPYEEAVEVLKRLKRSGHQLYYISARSSSSSSDNKKWFRWYSIPFDNITCVGHGMDKGVIAKKYQLELFVDDYEVNLEHMFNHKNKWKKGLMLMDRPWNRDSIDGSKFQRVYNWQEILRHIGIQNR